MRNKKLIQRYPFLLPRHWKDGKVSRQFDYSYTEYDYIMSGWKKAFGKQLLEDLRTACLKTDFLDKLYFLEIKEKYGQLRLYTNTAPKEVKEVIDKYEFISQYVCINCGNPHACIVDMDGWYLPLCENCWNKNNKQREKGGYKNKNKSWSEVSKDQQIGIPSEYEIVRYSQDEK